MVCVCVYVGVCVCIRNIHIDHDIKHSNHDSRRRYVFRKDQHGNRSRMMISRRTRGGEMRRSRYLHGNIMQGDAGVHGRPYMAPNISREMTPIKPNMLITGRTLY
jgi:hypothetical protein